MKNDQPPPIPNLLGDDPQPKLGDLLESIVGDGSPGLTSKETKEQSALRLTEESTYQAVAALSICEQAGMFGVFTVGRTEQDTVRVDLLKRIDGKVTNVGNYEGRTVIEAMMNAGMAMHRKFLAEHNGSQLASEYIKRNLAMDEVRRFKKPTVIVPSKQ
jgi:hypothetical protein